MPLLQHTSLYEYDFFITHSRQQQPYVTSQRERETGWGLCGWRRRRPEATTEPCKQKSFRRREPSADSAALDGKIE